MKIGIRTKVVLMLSMVALAPMLGALVAIVAVVRNFRRETFGEMILAAATAEARALETALARDLHDLMMILQDDRLVEELSRRVGRLPDDEIEELETAWPGLQPDDPRLAGILGGPASKTLQRLRELDPRYAEILITDRYGQLVTATGKTTDFYQADEEWWQGAFDSGLGRIFIPPVSFDESSAVWSVDLCVPIRNGMEVVGISKAVISLNRWIGDLRRAVEWFNASPMLVSSDGKVLFRRGVDPNTGMMAEEWSGPIAEIQSEGWRVTASGEIQAFVPIDAPRLPEAVGLEVEMPNWSLVMYMDEEEAFGPIYLLSMVLLSSGLIGIALLFLASVFLIERGVVRRILRIGEAARRVARGDLAARVSSPEAPPGIFRDDEIDALTRDFDDMVARIERSYQQLAEADALKKSFIQIAGHELRSPVSYILGMARLLERSGDPGRLREAVRTMSARAARLDRIIQSMFKLMEEGAIPQKLEYVEIEVPELLRESAAQVRPFLSLRGQKIETDAASGLPPLMADHDKLLDIFENLLTNAIKFTPDGGTIHFAATRGKNGEITFSVRDQGGGIAEKDIPFLFETFYCGGETFQHSSGEFGYQKRGMGLGLAVVKLFAELHGGSVGFRTGPEGSTFSVSIPIRPPESGPGEATAARGGPRNKTGGDPEAKA